MENTEQAKPGDFGVKMFLTVLWVASLLISGSIGYAWGQGNKVAESSPTKVLSESTLQASVTVSPTPQQTVSTNTNVLNNTEPTPTLAPTTSPISSTICSKTGYAQKWEYLTSYVVKQGDTVQNIAKEQLGDESRVNEILQINGVGLVIGATIYLPPSHISKSSGNIRQVYGKLMAKNSTSWHVGFTNDPKGQGILIPSFWFEGIANKDTFKIGDCVKVFFDDGFKVYSVALQ